MRTSRLGQNFLYDPSILLRIIETADLSGGDTVVEIGPGPGKLTRMLSERVAKVIAVELDRTLFEKLQADLCGYRNVELVNMDALQYPYEDIGDFKVVANIPYYITTPIIFRLLETGKRLKTMTLMVQKEVADRIAASPGTKDYGVLSIMVQYRAVAEKKFGIPKEAFRPVPKVDSAVLHFVIRDEPPVSLKDEEMFSRVVRTAFSQRRKTLANSLKPLTRDVRERLQEADIDPGRRPETLSMKEFAAIADILAGG